MGKRLNRFLYDRGIDDPLKAIDSLTHRALARLRAADADQIFGGQC
jgi:hypothetical protein